MADVTSKLMDLLYLLVPAVVIATLFFILHKRDQKRRK